VANAGTQCTRQSICSRDRDVQDGVKILLTLLSTATAVASSAGRIWGSGGAQRPWPDATRVEKGDHDLLNMERDYPIPVTILLAHKICINSL